MAVHPMNSSRFCDRRTEKQKLLLSPLTWRWDASVLCNIAIATKGGQYNSTMGWQYPNSIQAQQMKARKDGEIC
jgi:hypothetical protein